jgi:hypothetical protein
MKAWEEDNEEGNENGPPPGGGKYRKIEKEKKRTHRFFTRKAPGEGAENSRRRAYVCRKATAFTASSAGSGMPLSHALCCSAAADGR